MPRSYAHLDLDERRRLAKWREAKIPMKEIALRLGRDASTLYRELKRNFFRDVELLELNGYHAVAAQEMADRRRAVHRKMVVHPALKLAVVDRIKDGWTPEQIAYRMIHENARPRVCQETIYRYIYAKEGMRQELWWYLPTHRKARRPRRARKRPPPKFHRDVSILFRPDAVAHRRQFGHWEADLMLFKLRFGQTNVTSLVERVSRFKGLRLGP